MIYIYGDSHASFCFSKMQMSKIIKSVAGVTMHRIGRDGKVPYFDSSNHTIQTILCFMYGEVDCRCHICTQIDVGREEDDIIHTLVDNYMNTIRSIVGLHSKIVVVGVPPPVGHIESDRLVESDFPFVGLNMDRVRYTEKVNRLLANKCSEFSYLFFAPYSFYTDNSGCLIRMYSDGGVHIRDSTHFIQSFLNDVVLGK
jgi:hypothetical protein